MSDPSPHLPARFERTIADLERRLRILETRAGSGIGGDTDWIYPTLAGLLTPSTPNPVRYRKDASGFVHVSGGFTNSDTSAFSGGTVFTLPAGYRPKGTLGGVGMDNFQHILYNNNSGGVFAGRVTINGSSGIVRMETTVPSNGYVEFGALTFYADN